MEYCNDVLSGKIVAGELVKKACERHRKDFEAHPERWDLDEALRAIQFFPDVLRLAEGEHAGKPFELRPWQKFIVGSLFGWKGEDGYRRFRTAYIEIGKGNGKSPMAGGIGLYMMLADREIGAHCFAAAVTREQANILFQDAVKMVDASPALSSRIVKSGKTHVFNLAHFPTGSFFRSVSSEGKGLDGKRVHYAALDEIHEHPNSIVVDKMRAGTKGRRQALIFEITNSGYDRHSVCYQHHDYSEKILSGIFENDSWFAYVCQLDEGDDWKDERVWPKANPNLDVSVTSKYLREQVQEAREMPAKENIVKRLNFCVWTEQSTRAIPMEEWDAPEAKARLDPLSLKGRTCYGGLDLAKVNDLSAFVLVFPPVASGELWKALPWFWVPQDDIAVRSKRDRVGYDVWVKRGLMASTPGNVTDYAFIKVKILELAKMYDIREIAYDRTFAGEIVQWLADEGLTMVEFGQGFLSMASPTAELLRMIKGKELQHGGNEILRWNASNFSTKMDPAGNLKPDKEKSTDKIDGITALLMGLARGKVAPNTVSIYESRGLISL